MDPDWVPSVFSHKKALPRLQAAAKEIHHLSALKKKRDIARLQALRHKKTEIEKPSITVTHEIDMVVNESIPMVEIEVAELNGLKQGTESYRAELNKRNEEIYELRH